MSARHFVHPTAILRHAALLSSGTLILVPFVWMLSLSLKPPGEIFGASFSLLPHHWYAVENYQRALTSAPLLRYMANGLIVCAAILALQIAVCAPAGYALAKLRFKGRDVIFALVLIGLLLPHQVLSLPLFILGYQLNILNTYAALIFPYVVSPFGIFLFRQFFKTIPDDVVHAARLDGLPEISIVWRIMVPMALPAVIAFSIFSVVSHWNDLFWPLIAVRSEELMPPPLGIMAFRNEEAGNDYGPLMAAATLVVLPLVLAFVAAQRWFVEGLTGGAVK
ncbi:carbohydrate ABC transporter permease [Dongia sedimenti]|uniref:Carbohydrate ABC transporter permease n=1 Tax=Dongia sedimenti TaxID=3064282 RepID=A0ABU0YTL2_9PROT|nr:carbohydrate ABC transporter permease [Rhodospirillaceae bacterium R-7]